jgi:hypothetical protein
MYRLTGAPQGQPTKFNAKGSNGPLYFGDGERGLALALAEQYHTEGFRVRVIHYAPNDFHCIFDSKARARRQPKKTAA